MPKKPDVKIVEYPSGRELTAAEAKSGDYIFAAARDPKTLYAFPDTESLLGSWARKHRVGKHFNKAREALAGPPPAPPSEAELNAMWKKIHRDTDALEKYVEEKGFRFGDPKLLERAHKDGIIESALVCEKPGFEGLRRVISMDVYDLSRDFPYGARSCQSYAFQAVHLFEKPGWMPAPAFARLYGTTTSIPSTTVPFKSMRFY